ncbi:Clp protease N-terminal domain-containing protein [Lysobacter sp. 2RAB21]
MGQTIISVVHILLGSTSDGDGIADSVIAAAGGAAARYVDAAQAVVSGWIDVILLDRAADQFLSIARQVVLVGLDRGTRRPVAGRRQSA